MATSTPVRHAWRALTGLLVITALLFGINALGVYVFKQSSWTPELALDLQGGTQIVLEAQTEDGVDPTTEQMEQAVTIIRQRVDASGVGEADVTTQSGNQIVVQIPGQADEETRNRIEASAQLQLRAVLYTAAPANTFVGDDGKTTPYPTPGPDARGDADGRAEQRQRPRVDHPGAAGGVPRLRLRQPVERPGQSRPPTSRSITCDPDGRPSTSSAPSSSTARRSTTPRSACSRTTASGRSTSGSTTKAPRRSARSASACTAPTRRSTSSPSCSTAMCSRRRR